METAAAIPGAIATFAGAISALPAPVLTVNASLLTSLLETVAKDLAPTLPELAQAQQEALLTNATFLAGQFEALVGALAKTRPMLRTATHDEAIAMIQISATRYDVLTVWGPEAWAILAFFVIAAALKTALVVMLRKRAIDRAVEASMPTPSGTVKPTAMDREVARAKLQKPARAALGHALNLVVSTICIVLQLIAWRLFVLPSMPLRLLDLQVITAAIKLLLVGYAADLLFGDLRPEIFLHHFFTFALLFVGQLSAFKCQDPRFFRLAQYLLLQGTLEQTTYASMVAWHSASWLRVQDRRPGLQRRLMSIASRLMYVSKVTTFPQKFAPAGFAIYWLAEMWRNIDGSPWGRAWIVWCTMILVMLLILQVKFADDTFPLADHMSHKVHGGPPPPRLGPVFRAFARIRRKSSGRPRRPTLSDSQTSSDDRRSRSTSMTWLEKNVEEGNAVARPVLSGKDSDESVLPAPLAVLQLGRNSLAYDDAPVAEFAELPSLAYGVHDPSASLDSSLECAPRDQKKIGAAV